MTDPKIVATALFGPEFGMTMIRAAPVRDSRAARQPIAAGRTEPAYRAAKTCR